MELKIEKVTNGYILTKKEKIEDSGTAVDVWVVGEEDCPSVNGIDFSDAMMTRRLLWEIMEQLGLYKGKYEPRVKILVIDQIGKDVEADDYKISD